MNYEKVPPVQNRLLKNVDFLIVIILSYKIKSTFMIITIINIKYSIIININVII